MTWLKSNRFYHIIRRNIEIRGILESLSFVIPCYRSAKTIVSVLDEIEQVAHGFAIDDFEVITVIDGSPDNVAEILIGESKERNYLKVVELSKNYGQINAQMAGFRQASKDIIIALDDDGQCPVDYLDELIEPILKGDADFVSAKYPVKKQSAFKNFGSKMNQLMARSLVGMPKDFQISNFYAFTQLVNMELGNFPNPHPYFLGSILQTTSRVVNVPMEERDRLAGISGYTFRKLISNWLSGFSSFSVKPLRVADVIGALCACAGFLFGLYMVITRLMGIERLIGYSSIIASIFFVGGVIMILLGLIGEYVGRIMLLLNRTPQYVIRQIVVDGEIEDISRIDRRGPTL